MSVPGAVRVAFLGVDHPHGHGWRELLRNFDRIEIAALVPGYGGATCSLEERLSELPRFDSAEELIDWGQFDAAVVCLSNRDSPQAASALATAGKHVLLEKPGAASPAELRPLVEAVTSAGVAFQSGYMWRYDECAERLKRMVAERRFGKLICTEMTFCTSDVRRRNPDNYLFDKEISGRGFFNWLACHQLDLLLYVLDQPVVAVSGRVGTFGEIATEVEDGGAVILEMADGSLATFVGGYWLPRWSGEADWRIRGSQRWIHWRPAEPGTNGVLEIHGPMPQWIGMEEIFHAPARDVPGYGGSRGYDLVADWLRSIDDGTPCRSTVRSCVETLDVIESIYQAAEQGRRIDCPING